MIEYGTSEYVWARYAYAIARRNGELYSRRYYYFLTAWPIVWIGLGAFSAFSALSLGGSMFFLLIGLILGILMLKSLVKIRSYGRALEETYFPRYLDRDQTKFLLEISNEGIREYQGSIVLSAAWRDVVSTSLEDDLLIISLKGLRRIIIPRTSFGVSDLELVNVRNEIEQLRKAAGHVEGYPPVAEWQARNVRP